MSQECQVLATELGGELARFAEQAAEKFPDALKRCSTCAFRRGTFPNNYFPTVADAMKCALERTPFYCHEGDPCGEGLDLCAGWLLMQKESDGNPPIKAPWPFVDELENSK